MIDRRQDWYSRIKEHQIVLNDWRKHLAEVASERNLDDHWHRTEDYSV